jgi:hypothetical protein
MLHLYLESTLCLPVESACLDMEDEDLDVTAALSLQQEIQQINDPDRAADLVEGVIHSGAPVLRE